MGTISDRERVLDACAKDLGEGISGSIFGAASIVGEADRAIVGWALFYYIAQFWREYPQWTAALVDGWLGMAEGVPEYQEVLAQSRLAIGAFVAEHPL